MLAFVLDDSADWSEKWTEHYRLVEASLNREPPENISTLSDEIQRNVDSLADFRSWLETEYQRKLFNPCLAR